MQTLLLILQYRVGQKLHLLKKTNGNWSCTGCNLLANSVYTISVLTNSKTHKLA